MRMITSVSAVVLCLASSGAFGDASFRLLDGSGQGSRGQLFALTPDGSSAAGQVFFGLAAGQASTCNAATGGMMQLGHAVFSRPSVAYAVALDGAMVGGHTENDPLIAWAGAVKWAIGPDGNTAIPLPQGPRGYRSYSDGVRGLTSDGQFAVGQSGDQAVTWQGTTVAVLDESYTGLSRASAVTPTGSRVVGFHTIGSGIEQSRAFMWTASGGGGGSAVDLPALRSEDQADAALAVSADGRTIVGYAGSAADGVRLTRWTIDPVSGQASVLDLGLGTALLPLSTIALPGAAVSADGSVIGGMIFDINRPDGVGEAALWSAATGLVKVSDLLAQCGIALPEDPTFGGPIRLTEVTGISADGRTVVGNWTVPGSPDGLVIGWIATIPAPGAAGVLGLAGCIAAGARRRRG